MADQWLTAVQGTVGDVSALRPLDHPQGRLLARFGRSYRLHHGSVSLGIRRVVHAAKAPRSCHYVQPEGANMTEPILGDQPASQSGGNVRCVFCGRVGIRGFRAIDERTAWRCLGEKACQARASARSKKAIERGEAEIASDTPLPTLDEVIEQSGRPS